MESQFRFTAPFGVVLLCLLALVVLPFLAELRLHRQDEQTGVAIEDAQQIAGSIHTLLTRQVAAARAFALTGNELLLQDLNAASTRYDDLLPQLRAAVLPLGAGAVARVDNLELAAGLWMERQRTLIAGAADRAAFSEQSLDQQEQIEALLLSLAAVGDALGVAALQRRARFRQASREASLIAVALSFIAMIAAIAVGLAARRQQRLITDAAAARDIAMRRGTELAATLAQRQRAVAALRESEMRLRKAVDLAPYPLMIHAEDGEVLRISRAWAEISGYTQEEIPTVEEWARRAFGDPESPARAAMSAEATTRSDGAGIEHLVHTQDGELRNWDFRTASLGRLRDGRRIAITAAIDVTARTEVENLLRTSNDRLEFLFDTTTQLLAGKDADVLIASVFAELQAMIGLDLYLNYVLETDDAGREQLRLTSSAGIDDSTAAGLRCIDIGHSFCGAAARDRRRIVVDDVQSAIDPMTDTMRSLGVSACACFPLISRGRLLGTFAVATRQHARIEADDLVFINIIADELASAMDRADTYRSERTARQAAEQASVAKDQFLAVMSHELRTPLTAIAGYSDLLLDAVPDPLTDRQRTYIDRMRQSAWYLAQVIDEVLTFARTQAGKEQAHFALVDVAAIVRGAISLVEAEAAEKGLQLRTTLPAGSLMLDTDAGKLRRILLNLVGNAVKFTDAGSVCVEVAVAEDNLHVRVSDTGPGIAPDVLPHIFEPFFQADASNTRSKGGTGLGLTITRDLAHLLGGSVAVESAPGQGSEFHVVLPARVPVAAGANLPGSI
jgi:PAS domain S-box-containing protein